jgi:hypothetical protein
VLQALLLLCERVWLGEREGVGAFEGDDRADLPDRRQRPQPTPSQLQINTFLTLPLISLLEKITIHFCTGKNLLFFKQEPL